MSGPLKPVPRSFFNTRTRCWKVFVIAIVCCSFSCSMNRFPDVQCLTVEPPIDPFLSVSSQDLMESLVKSPQSNQARANLLLKEFERRGCLNAGMSVITGSLHKNVVCTLEGATNVTVVVAAHYDKTRRGNGVADNWTGVALLPYLYAEMAARKPRHTYVFAGFAEEETELLGSSHYVSKMMPEELNNTAAMINLDTLGLGLMQADPRSSRFLMHRLGCAALGTGSEIAPSRLYRWISGDWEPFKAVGVPVLNLHSLSPNRKRLIHSARDSMLIIKMDEYLNSFRLIRQLLVELDSSID